ncbi:MAG: metallophosphoesterase [Planctomycetes bacterium]|nr:metallophosphoesterase [Planctomycetota bacterium]
MGPKLSLSPHSKSSKFSFMGDCHSHRTTLRSYVETAEMRKVEFGFLMGDFVDYDEDANYRHFIDRIGDPKIPIFLVRGNHEALNFNDEDSNRYLDYIPKSNYYFIHAGILFGVLDNSGRCFKPGVIEEANIELSKFRKMFPDGTIILTMHIPPNVEGTRSKDLIPSSSKRLLRLCKKYKVEYILCGHLHDEAETTYEGTKIIVDGCGGGSILSTSTQCHYLEFTNMNGQLNIEKVPLERDNPAISRIDYIINVSVDQYRFWFIAISLLLFIRELISISRMKNV